MKTMRLFGSMAGVGTDGVRPTLRERCALELPDDEREDARDEEEFARLLDEAPRESWLERRFPTTPYPWATAAKLEERDSWPASL